MSDPSNMQNFTENSYNLTGNKTLKDFGFCIKPGSIYTNPEANFNYFTPQCTDSYTAYNYWYRRFPNQNSFLNCYYLPQKSVYFKNKWGYEQPGKRCYNSNVNYHVNQRIGGFNFFDTQINPVTPRVSLRM